MLHVLPIDDLKEHTMRASCWCHPTRAAESNDVLVHNSLDGREALELHEEVFGKAN